jgi:hypothetical protein
MTAGRCDQPSAGHASGVSLLGHLEDFSDTLATGFSRAHTQNLTINLLVMLKRNSTRLLRAVAKIIMKNELCVTHLRLLPTGFGTQAVSLSDGVLIVAIGTAFFALIEITKQIRLGVNNR